VKESARAVRRKTRLIEICESFPEVVVSGDRHLAFRVRKKIFAYYLFDHHGDGLIAFTCTAEPGVQRDLVEVDPGRFFVPAYVGPKGWVAIRLDLPDVDWGVVAALARGAYQLTAPNKLAASV
jgi:hypothetical protein